MVPIIAWRSRAANPRRVGRVTDARTRCGWATSDPLSQAYHDAEWGVPLHDERSLFELLCLEGAQAGLAWITILRKRDGYRRAFENWDVARLASYGPDDEARLLADPGIVRNCAKIRSVIGNARATLDLADGGGLDAHVWSFVGGEPVQNAWRSMADIPAETEASRELSRDLRSRRFKFVGPTIVYAFMQSAGLVNDHVVSCYRHREVAAMGRTT
jgi:DNA-3-methyladenine glycosylase I